MIVWQKVVQKVSQELKIRNCSLMTLQEYLDIKKNWQFPETKLLSAARDGQNIAWWLRDIVGEKGFIADRYWTYKERPLTYRANIRPTLYFDSIRYDNFLKPGETFYIDDIEYFICSYTIAVALTPIANAGYYFMKKEVMNYENSLANEYLEDYKRLHLNIEKQ